MSLHGLVDLPIRAGEPLDREEVARWLSSLDERGFEEIEELRVARRQLDDAALGPLAASLLATPGQRSFPRLRALDLSRNLLTDHGSVLLAECAAALRRRPAGGLATLLLAGNRIGPEGAEALAMSFFPPGISSGGSEFTLSLSENPIGDGGVTAVATAVRIRGCQVALHLRDVGCSEDGCGALAESLRHVALLDLGKNPVPEAALETLALAMGPPLRHLGLSRLAPEAGRSLLGGPSPTGLALCEGLARSGAPLRVLALAGDELQDSGFQDLMDALSNPSAPAIEDLDLAYNRIRNGNLLANFLAGGGRHLVSLSLEGNDLNDLALFAFAAGISLSPCLRRLNLARNRFGDGGAVALAQALQHQCSTGLKQRAATAPVQPAAARQWLQQLGVPGNQPRMQVADEPGVQRLDLSFNVVTDEGAQALSEVPCLVQLSLCGTNVGGPGSEALLGAIRASHVRVERAVAEVYTALGAGTGPLPSRLPWPLLIEGLGLEQLEADFAARAKAWADIPLTLTPQGPTQPQASQRPAASSPSPVPVAVAEPVALSGPLEVALPGRLAAGGEAAEAAAAGAGGYPSTVAAGAPASAEMTARQPPEAPVAVQPPPPAPAAAAAPPPPPAPLAPAAPAAPAAAPPLPPAPAGLQAADAPPPAATPAVAARQPPGPLEVAGALDAAAAVKADDGGTASSTLSLDASDAGGEKQAHRADDVLERARKALQKVGSRNKLPPTPQAAAAPKARVPPLPEGVAAAPGPPAKPEAGSPAKAEGSQQQQQQAPSEAAPPAAAAPASGAAAVALSRAEAAVSRARSALQKAQEPEPEIPEERAAAAPTPPLGADPQLDSGLLCQGSEGLLVAPGAQVMVGPPSGSGLPVLTEQVAEEAGLTAEGADSAAPPDVLQQQEAEVQSSEPDAGRDAALAGSAQGELGGSLDSESAASTLPAMPEAPGAPAAEPAEASQAAWEAQEAQGAQSDLPTPMGVEEGGSSPSATGSNIVAVPLPASVAHVARRLPMADPEQLALVASLMPPARGKGTAPPPPPKGPGAAPPKGKGGPPGPKVPKGPPKAPPAKAQPKGSQAPDGQAGDGPNSKAAPFHRKLYWKQLDIADAEGTIFDDLQKERGRQSNPLFDVDALTRMFEGEKEKSAKLARRSTGLLNKVQLKSVGVKLISDHRARNMAIVLKRLPVSSQELSRILRALAWEASAVTMDDLEQITEVIPTKEECEKLREYRSPEARTLLRDVEQMVLPLALLNRAAARVRLVSIARSARASFGTTARTLAAIRAACHAIHRSAMLREVMMLALDIGNYINHADSSKGAKAIAVGSLVALKDFKTGRMSSLHFLCASMLRSNPDRDAAEAMSKELRPAAVISRLQVQTIQSAMRHMTRDLEVVTAECRNYLHEYEAAADAADEQAEQGQDGQSQDLEEYEAMAVSETPDFNEEDATRFVEDVMKIRGSASWRLQCMRRVVEKLQKLLRVDMETTAEQAHAALRFCGVTTPKTKEVPTEFESLLGQLSEFQRVFRTHWDEVKEDMSSYLQLFGDPSGRGPVLR